VFKVVPEPRLGGAGRPMVLSSAFRDARAFAGVGWSPQLMRRSTTRPITWGTALVSDLRRCWSAQRSWGRHPQDAGGTLARAAQSSEALTWGDFEGSRGRSGTHSVPRRQDGDSPNIRSTSQECCYAAARAQRGLGVGFTRSGRSRCGDGTPPPVRADGPWSNPSRLLGQ